MYGDPVVYNTCVEGLFLRGLQSRMTPRCRERLRRAGLDLDRMLAPTYPIARWRDFLRIAAEELFPFHSTESAHAALGVCFMDGFLETFIGRATLSVLRMLGPRRGLTRISSHLRSGNNFSEARHSERGPTEVEVWINNVFADHPEFVAALIARAHEAAGARDVEVSTLGFDGTAATFLVRWTEVPHKVSAPSLYHQISL